MRTFNVHEAKTQFSKLLEAAIGGDEVIIAKAGKPVAKLVAFTKVPPRRMGLLKGKIKIAADFDDPLPEDFFSSAEK